MACGVFKTLENPEYPVNKAMYKDIVYDKMNDKNFKLLSVVICKSFERKELNEFMVQNQKER